MAETELEIDPKDLLMCEQQLSFEENYTEDGDLKTLQPFNKRGRKKGRKREEQRKETTEGGTADKSQFEKKKKLVFSPKPKINFVPNK